MKPVLETIDLKMVYHVGKVDVPALRGVNVQIREGEYVAIMGPSGCGKSTFLHIVGGMLQPTSGRVRIDGEDMTEMTDAARTDVRRRKIGFVFQRFNLFPTLSALDNLRLTLTMRGWSLGAATERFGKLVFVWFASNAAINATTTRPSFCM